MADRVITVRSQDVRPRMQFWTGQSVSDPRQGFTSWDTIEEHLQTIPQGTSVTVSEESTTRQKL
eukprot:310538-Amphidinium_carterae.1